MKINFPKLNVFQSLCQIPRAQKITCVSKLQVGVESETAGKHIAEAAVNYVKEWNLLELIYTMHFDTTNTNMGKL